MAPVFSSLRPHKCPVGPALRGPTVPEFLRCLNCGKSTRNQKAKDFLVCTAAPPGSGGRLGKCCKSKLPQGLEGYPCTEWISVLNSKSSCMSCCKESDSLVKCVLCDRELCLNCIVIESFNLSQHTGNENTLCYSCCPNFTRITPKGRPYFCYFCLADHTDFPGLPPCLDPKVPVLPLVENLREGISVREASSRAVSTAGSGISTPRSIAESSQRGSDPHNNWLINSSSVGLRGLFRSGSQISLPGSASSHANQPLPGTRNPSPSPSVRSLFNSTKSQPRSRPVVPKLNDNLHDLVTSTAIRANQADARSRLGESFQQARIPSLNPNQCSFQQKYNSGMMGGAASDPNRSRPAATHNTASQYDQLHNLVVSNAHRAGSQAGSNCQTLHQTQNRSQDQTQHQTQSQSKYKFQHQQPSSHHVIPPTSRANPNDAFFTDINEVNFDQLLPLIDDRMSRVVNASIRPLQQALCSAAANISSMEKRLNSKDASTGSNADDNNDNTSGNDKCIQWSKQDQLSAKRAIDKAKPLQSSDVRQLVNNGADKITTEIKVMTKSIETTFRSLVIGTSRQNQRAADNRNPHPGKRGKQSKRK